MKHTKAQYIFPEEKEHSMLCNCITKLAFQKELSDSY